MERRSWRAARPICQSCLQSLRQSRKASSIARPLSTRANGAIPFRHLQLPAPNPAVTQFSRGTQKRGVAQTRQARRTPTANEVDAELLQAQQLAGSVLNSASIPSEEETLRALAAIDTAAQHLLDANGLDRPRPSDSDNPTSALLELDVRHKTAKKPTPESAPLKKTIDELSDLTYRLVKHPAVFLTPQILARYVDIQSFLLRPASFPEILALYASKPTPSPSKSPDGGIKYSAPAPNAIATAVDSNVANTALNAALQTRQLPLALDIIDTTFTTASFRRNKIFRRAVPPVTGAALMPVAAYTVASSMAAQQTGYDPSDFTQIAFAGIVTYAACVGTIGYVALTTANDQMQRVTWAIGMPLWERWLREEERAAADRVALAWGFQQRSRWGEEEGDEWELLREWCGMRGMVLDKVGLMEGME